MPILQKVTIKSFKSIVDQSLDLGQLNIFVGENGAGKSNFLEAVGMLSAAVSGEINYAKLAERGVRLSSPEVFRSAFRNINRKITFMLEGQFENFLYDANISSVPERVNPNPWNFHAEKLRRGKKLDEPIGGRSNRVVGIAGRSDFDRGSLKRNESIVSSIQALGGFLENEVVALEALKDFAIYSPSTPVLRGITNDESYKRPLGLYGGGMAGAMADVIRSESFEELNLFFSLFDWYRTVGYKKPSAELQSSHVQSGTHVVAFTDKFMPRSFNELLAYDVSEGALYVLFVLLLLGHNDAPKIFALDNVDNALNPGLVTELVAHIGNVIEKNSDYQIFMTTHNPTTLDSIDLFNSKHRLFVVKRSEEGKTVFERIKPPKGFTKKKWQSKFKHMKLSDIWLSGIIEGIASPEGF